LFSCKQKPNQQKLAAVNEEQKPITFVKNTSKQDLNNLSKDLSEFLPKNYSILDTASGDLNLDQIQDYILVLSRNGEDTLSSVVEHHEKRPLLILLGDQSNKLQLARRNDNTVYCFDCGGVMGDPYVGITIKNGYFSVEHYGGSAWRWTRIITYKYSKQDKEWFLHKDGSESFHALEPDKVESKIKTIKDFGKITFEQFGYITPLVLSILYGIYQKVLSDEKDETVELLRTTLSNAYNNFAEEESVLESKITELKNENKNLIFEIQAKDLKYKSLTYKSDLEKKVIVDEVIIEKPKRTRKK
jgi:hypothetical protein